ncbi:MAG: SAM-dependent methyltransferase [Candidatus Heimdallarchaeota archaeon]|nr:SAM-dependent methyltransferase [Candidatus Heimdallarchaeota archaeon]MBY8994366.1 SAM-dependent methyltransferase [Candidatus Heimdallarchaeota archaeon]
MTRDLTAFLHDLKKTKTTQDANSLIKSVSNIDNLLTSLEDKEEFIDYIEKMQKPAKKNLEHKAKEWGDVQTPEKLVDKVYQILADSNFDPSVIIEPTSGTGSFILHATKVFRNLKLIYGVEIQKHYIWCSAAKIVSQALNQEEQGKHRYEIRLIHDDIFTHEFDQDILNSDDSTILVIGNPPWVTISELSSLNSNNLPLKSNIKGFKGIDALTGKSNFDITETIIVKLIKLFSRNKGKIAILCKNTVVRNILKETIKSNLKISNIRALNFKAKEYFGKICNASLFIADFTPNKNDTFCSISDLEEPSKIIKKFGWFENHFVSNIEKYKQQSQLEGQFPINWRQGIKHDCATILELQLANDGKLLNKNNEVLEVEEDLVYPLLKGSALRKLHAQDISKRLILTQTKLSEDTNKIKEMYPKTWQYLMKNKKTFSRRKSRVFQKKPDFAIFGVGDYVLSPYKVAIAGFYKKPIFTFVTPYNEKPVLFDDTCYYLSFQNYNEALFTCSVLNSEILNDFLESIVFIDSKRPFTKEVLMRINLAHLVKNTTFATIKEIWKSNSFSPEVEVTENDYRKFQDNLKPKQLN